MVAGVRFVRLFWTQEATWGGITSCDLVVFRPAAIASLAAVGPFAVRAKMAEAQTFIATGNRSSPADPAVDPAYLYAGGGH